MSRMQVIFATVFLVILSAIVQAADDSPILTPNASLGKGKYVLVVETASQEVRSDIKGDIPWQTKSVTLEIEAEAATPTGQTLHVQYRRYRTSYANIVSDTLRNDPLLNNISLLLDVPFDVTLNAAGDAVTFQGLDKLWKRLADSRIDDIPLPTMMIQEYRTQFGEKQLTKWLSFMLGKNALPETNVKVGDDWRHTTTVDSSGVTMEVPMKYHFKSMEGKGGNASALIDVSGEGQTTLTPEQLKQFRVVASMSIQTQLSGSMSRDLATGQIRQYSVTAKFHSTSTLQPEELQPTGEPSKRESTYTFKTDVTFTPGPYVRPEPKP